jgi:hypothetical protein
MSLDAQRIIMPCEACVRSENTNQNDNRCASDKPANKIKVSLANNVRGRRGNLFSMIVFLKYFNFLREHVAFIAHGLDVTRFASAILQSLS